MGNLVIVESPTKARKIQGYLGDGYVVKSSEGHIRDLSERNLSIDVENGFKPEYVIPDKKKKLVSELKKEVSKADTVWLASDEDREGEAIAWHLSEVLGLSKEQTKRIVFHEVTKPALLEAIRNPREVNLNLVASQQARRVLDRLVGFELSPVLWRKIQPRLSAGRVQSVALRLVVDREREIEAFRNEAYYKVDAVFEPEGSKLSVRAGLGRRLKDGAEVEEFLNRCTGASYKVGKTSDKEGTKSPAAPFTTYTLQQEAYRKLGMSIQQTMQVAQNLYEEGLITYMRTDSVNLSSLAINTAKQYIRDNFGDAYSKPRQYRNTDKSAQEAHEAIRPTYIETTEIKGTPAEQRLYQLIWKRTVASQMADAKVINSTVEIDSDKVGDKFIAEASKVTFDGFLKLYIEGSDDEQSEDKPDVMLPKLVRGTVMVEKGISAVCRFTQGPQRYNQASLIQKLKDLGIGRPSTLATIYGTLVKGRGYIVEGNKEGKEVQVSDYYFKDGKISLKERTEKIGADKRKLLPQDIGIMVSDYLVEHFSDVMDYQFTADVEHDFDEVAEGRRQWDDVISSFYAPFHKEIVVTMADNRYSRLEREIGIDPSDGQMITARYGQYGPYIQKGEGENKVYASLQKGQIIESLTLEEALKLFLLPRKIGQLDGVDVIVTKGKFGPYIKYGAANISVPRGQDPLQLTLEQAAKLIESVANKPTGGVVAEWGDVSVVVGPYGPYIKTAEGNYKLPKGTDPYVLREEEVREIIKNSSPTAKKRRLTRKK